MKPPNSLTDEDLLAYADRHLKYEIDMLIWAAGIMRTLAPVRDQGLLAWACNNALLNSFSMHARNLIDFLYLCSLGKDRPTDIIVQDYIDDRTLSKHLPQMTCPLQEAKRKADKQVAHLTLDRIQYQKSGKEWPFGQMAVDIMEAFRAIAPDFPETRSSDSFRGLISRPRLIIPPVTTTPTYSREGLPTGITFQITLTKAEN